MNTTEPTRELIPLKLIQPWARNPRGGELREMERFTQQLRVEGIREDLHLFRNAQGVLTVMQGHRRRKAAENILAAIHKEESEDPYPNQEREAMRKQFSALWCKVWAFEENEAFLHLLTMQNGPDPFDARELAKASRTAMEMGIAKEELIGAMHRSAETVQLYLDLGTLPHRVQEAVYRGRLALGTAGLMRQLSKEQMELAMDGVLNNPITQEPMTEGQARVYIKNQFLKPERWRKEWEVLCLKVKRKLVAGGMDVGLVDVVAWEDREQFVMSEALPQSAYALCEEHIEDGLLVKPGEPMTWGALALSLGVPWHVAPAMARAEKHVLIVKVSAVKDADSTSAERVLRARGEKAKAERKGAAEGGEQGAGRREQGEERRAEGGEQGAGRREQGEERRAEGGEAEDKESVDSLECANKHFSPDSRAAFAEERWMRVVAKLMERKETVMQDALWKPLVAVARACAVRGLSPAVVSRVEGVLAGDESLNRQGMRHVMAWKLAQALCSGDEEAVRGVERVLSIVG